MLQKCNTQYASKFGKLSSGHGTGKGQFSFQSQRRAMSKNVQTTAQLCLFHTLAKQCSKSFKLSTVCEPKTSRCRKVRGTRDQIANICWIIEKVRESPQKICFIDYTKVFDCVDNNKHWKILKEMGIPDHLICLLRNLYAGQEATVRTRHGTIDWFKIGTRVCQGCILSPCLFNLYAEYIMRNPGLDKAQAGIKTAGRNINNLSYADDITLTQKVKRK